MDAKEFYDEKNVTKRSLHEGNKTRNSHNFIKAVLIDRFIGKRKRILDLGCGQGGDLLKIKHSCPSLYVGMDLSPNAIASAQIRASSIRLNCRCHFLCTNFTKHDWEGYPPYDVVNCQFAIQFAFKSKSDAMFTFERISRFLVEDGFFIGTVPKHNANTYDEVEVELLDDDRKCKEYAVTREDLISICNTYNLNVVLIEDFQPFFQNALQTNEYLATKMNATHNPDPCNIVFAFQKRSTDKDV
jgi:SAM-dependent methyltransferase